MHAECVRFKRMFQRIVFFKQKPAEASISAAQHSTSFTSFHLMQLQRHFVSTGERNGGGGDWERTREKNTSQCRSFFLWEKKENVKARPQNVSLVYIWFADVCIYLYYLFILHYLNLHCIAEKICKRHLLQHLFSVAEFNMRPRVGAVGSAAVLHLQSFCFNPVLWSFASSPHVLVAFLWILWFPPISQKHTGGWNS